MSTSPATSRDAITPHGNGELVNLWVPESSRREMLSRAARLPVVVLGPRALSDLEMLANGAFSPLTGFMGREDYECSCAEMKLSSGTIWPIPITLGVREETARELEIGAEVALADPDGRRVAVLTVREVFEVDREREAVAVFGTADNRHPGVRNLLDTPSWCLAGPVSVFASILEPEFPEFHLPPAQTREAFRKRGWKRIAAFQTRNPVHRAHEYIQKTALEICDGLLLHPLVGETKSDDVPAAVRMETYKALLTNYYPQERVLLAVMPAYMRYAGPREAVLHAIIRRNYGCTHFIVGRDHAGVGSYYGPYDAQRIFEQFHPDELGIVPLPFENTFYCRRCEGMASLKTCPHDAANHVTLSGTRVREMLVRGELPPPEVTRREIAEILIRAMKQNQ